MEVKSRVGSIEMFEIKCITRMTNNSHTTQSAESASVTYLTPEFFHDDSNQ